MNEPTIAEQAEQVKQEIDKEQKKWEQAELPPPGNIWRLGVNEFAIHCHVHALDRLVRRLGITDEEFDLEMDRVFLEEAQKMFPDAVAARKQAKAMESEMKRRQIIEGINPFDSPNHN